MLPKLKFEPPKPAEVIRKGINQARKRLREATEDLRKIVEDLKKPPE